MLNPESEEVYLAMIVDKMAQRYSKLPSEILSTANTTDLRIMDIAESFINYKRNLAKADQQPTPQYTEAQLIEINRKAKKRK